MGRTDPPTLHTLPVRSTLERWLPLLRLLRIYQLKWLIKDLFAGLAPCAVLVPVGLSYAEAAGLPVIDGERCGRRIDCAASTVHSVDADLRPRCRARRHRDLRGTWHHRGAQRPALWRIHRNEFAVSILSFVGVVTLGALPGILIAVGLALISFVWRTRSQPFGKPDSY